MALFRRRPSVPDTPPDAEFPFWSQSDADEFRDLAGRVFATHLTGVTVHPDHVADASGMQFGLSNLAAACQQAGDRRRWRPVVERHVAALGIGQPDELDSMTDAQVLAATYWRVIPTDALLPGTTYASQVAPGLTRVLNLDLPTKVLYLGDQHVRRWGLDTLDRAGTVNLRTVRPDERRTLDRDGASVQVLLGESLFTASLVLVLEDVMAGCGEAVDPGTGVLVGAPFRHQLAYHVPRDASVLPSLNLLAGFCASGYRDAVGPVSPDVFWWRPGRSGGLQRLTRVEGDAITVDTGPEFVEMLERVT